MHLLDAIDDTFRWWHFALIGDARRAEAAGKAIDAAAAKARSSAEADGLVGWAPEPDGTFEYVEGYFDPPTDTQRDVELRAFYEVHHQEALLSVREALPHEVEGLAALLREHGPEGGAAAAIASRVAPGFVTNPVILHRLVSAAHQLSRLRQLRAPEIIIEDGARRCEVFGKLALDVVSDEASARAILDSEEMWDTSGWPLEERCLEMCVVDFRPLGIGGLPDHLSVRLPTASGRPMPGDWCYLGGEDLRAYADDLLREHGRLTALRDELAAVVEEEDATREEVALAALAAATADRVRSFAAVARQLATQPAQVLLTTVAENEGI